MNLKKLLEKMKHYSFWISLSGALIIFLNCLGNIFGFEIENNVVENVIMSFAGVLVVFGLVVKDDQKTENMDEENKESEKNDEDDFQDDGNKENAFEEDEKEKDEK